MSDHFMHAFRTGELCSGRVSINLLQYCTFLENILIEGKARNKNHPVSERKSSHTVCSDALVVVSTVSAISRSNLVL